VNARDLLVALKEAIPDAKPGLVLGDYDVLCVALADLPLPSSRFELYVLDDADLARSPADVAAEIAAVRAQRRAEGA
jgi:hypothetical protein